MPAQALERIDRFLWEYVGNVAPEELEVVGGGAAPHEWHGDGETRALLDEIISEMDRRHVSSFEQEAFLENLRGVIRSEARLRASGVEDGEAERRFLETQRWVLAERFHLIVEDAPPDIVARIRLGFQSVPDAARHGPDPDT